jgi:hypothetical protein
MTKIFQWSYLAFIIIMTLVVGGACYQAVSISPFWQSIGNCRIQSNDAWKKKPLHRSFFLSAHHGFHLCVFCSVSVDLHGKPGELTFRRAACFYVKHMSKMGSCETNRWIGSACNISLLLWQYKLVRARRETDSVTICSLARAYVPGVTSEIGRKTYPRFPPIRLNIPDFRHSFFIPILILFARLNSV